jgi:hypothetical protein
MRARPLAALLAGLLGVAAAGHGVDDRVYLPGVNALVFTRDQVTFSRLGHPHEQLACVGGDARGDAAVMPTLVECYNKGGGRAAALLCASRDGGVCLWR